LANVAQETHRRTPPEARFLIGLVAVLAISFAATTAQQTPAKQETTTSTTFVLRIISDGNLCPSNNLNCEEKNIWWGNFALLASDGHTVNLMSIPFPSVARSKREFDSMVKNADKIIRRNLESNSNGERVGERVLGFFPEVKGSKPPSGPPHYKLFWTRGSNYWEITGEHLDDVLSLEERLKEEGVKAVWGLR
jgi:hypothetical protein